MELLFYWIIGTITTFLATPIVIRIALKYNLVDNPHTRYHPAHTHKGLIPRAGGLAILLGLLLSMMLFLSKTMIIWSIAICSIGFVIIGLIDDKKDINPYLRLFGNSILILFVIFQGVQIPFITNPITGGIVDFHIVSLQVNNPYIRETIYPISILFAFLWMMWITNIIGWSAGVEGQMPGFVSISSFVLAILSMRYSVEDPSLHWVTVLGFIISGSFAGFIPWNFFPQKIMPGYGGKTLAGFLLAVLSILSFGKLGTALLVLGVPTIDAVITLLRRLVLKRPLVQAERGHLHHILLDLGWGKRKISLFYWTVSAILGLISLSITSTQKVFTYLIVLVVIGGGVLWLNLYSHSLKQHDQDNG